MEALDHEMRPASAQWWVHGDNAQARQAAPPPLAATSLAIPQRGDFGCAPSSLIAHCSLHPSGSLQAPQQRSAAPGLLWVTAAAPPAQSCPARPTQRPGGGAPAMESPPGPPGAALEDHLVACVQHSLGLYLHDNACFMAERLVAQFPSEARLGSCHQLPPNRRRRRLRAAACSNASPCASSCPAGQPVPAGHVLPPRQPVVPRVPPA